MQAGNGEPQVNPTARLYTAAGVRELDRRAIEDHGVEGYRLMGRAGAAAFRLLCLRWPGCRRLAVFAGGGNNGGDALVVARLAHVAGITTDVVVSRAPEELRGSAARAWADFVAAGGQAIPLSELDCSAADVIVDGILGTGLDRPVRGTAAQMIERINAASRPVLALDIPSGLSADSGAILGCAVRGHATLTFIGHKRGLFTGQGPAVTGPVFCDDLGVPAAIYDGVEPWIEVLDDERGGTELPRRAPTAHKGDAGRILVIGGNTGMAGAVRLAAETALRIGAGLVTVATQPSHAPSLTAARPELMVHGVAAPEAELAPLLKAADTVVIGPGLGRDDWAEAALATTLDQAAGRPLVVDADGLNIVATQGRAVPRNSVLTPHPGEAGRLLGDSGATVQQDRFAALDGLVERFGASVVLKGAGTLIAGPGERTALLASAHPALATGGTGDVLAGAIGGLLAQGCQPVAAARGAVWLHARAARAVVGEADCGLIAGDLAAAIGRERAQSCDG